jgi:hypothetical protein
MLEKKTILSILFYLKKLKEYIARDDYAGPCYEEMHKKLGDILNIKND